MGIQDLNKVLKDKCPSVFKYLPITSLKGMKVAIDAHNVMYSNLAVAHKEIIFRTNVILEEVNQQQVTFLWLRRICDFANDFLKYGVTPVFVFDGKPVKQKEGTREERKAQREKKMKEIKELKDTIDKTDTLSHTPAMMMELRRKMSQVTALTKEQNELLITCFKYLNIPYLKAKHDGEQLCSMLCRENLVAAVYSKDTDNLAYGCPLLITDFAFNKNVDDEFVPFYNAINYADVIKELNFTEEQFIDLCITLGCDFNNRIPRVGQVKAYNLIKKHGSIDKYEFDEKKIELLDHKTCRSIFKPVKASELVEKEEKKNWKDKMEISDDFSEDARDYLDTCDLSGYLELFSSCYRNMIKERDGIKEEKKEEKKKIKIKINKK